MAVEPLSYQLNYDRLLQ